MLLRSLAKLAAVAALAGGGGVLLGVALSELTSDTVPATSDEPSPQTTVRGSTTSATPSIATRTTTSGDQSARARARVQILGAVLHPAATPSGRRRQRARLIVRIRAENRGTQPVTVAPPALLAGDTRIQTDPSAATPRTRLGELAADETRTVTLRFELEGAITAKITAERRAQIVVAGRSRPIPVEIGAPLRPRQTTTLPTTTPTVTTTTP